MVLGFTTQINGKPTNFVEKINAHLLGVSNGFLPKKHTIRVDAKSRWRVGMPIQFATGVRTPKYKQFAMGVCTKIGDIKIRHCEDAKRVWINGDLAIHKPNFTSKELVELAMNDGFDSVEDFFAWFNKDFEGRIIHF